MGKAGNFLDCAPPGSLFWHRATHIGFRRTFPNWSFQVSRSLLRLASRSLGLLLLLSGMSGVASAVAVPEVDPASATSALALLVGAAMLARDKFRRL